MAWVFWLICNWRCCFAEGGWLAFSMCLVVVVLLLVWVVWLLIVLLMVFDYLYVALLF